MIAPQEKLSQVSFVAGQSPRGLLKTEEAVKSLKKGAAAGGLVYALMIVAEYMLADFGSWYIGPAAKSLTGLAGMAAMYFRAERMARKLGDKGDDL